MRALFAAFLLMFSTQAKAADSFELNNTHGAVIATEFVVSIGLGFFAPDFLPDPPADPSCDETAWCATNGFDVALNDLMAFKNGNARWMGHLSHVFTIGLTPALGFGGAIAGAAMEGKAGYAVADIFIMLSAFNLATGLNSVAKTQALRQRPAFTNGREANTEAANHGGEEFVSFYSGDTTWAFVLASSATTLVYLRGYEFLKPIAYTLGGLAIVGSLMRMIADMHWATDVLVGAVAGTTVGTALPLLLHKRKPGLDGYSGRPKAQFYATANGLRAEW